MLWEPTEIARLPSWQDQLAIGSFVVTVFGFAIAIWQIRKSVKASEATTIAVRVTANRLAANQLLLLVPQLELIDYELDLSIRANDREGVERSLVRWRYLSSKIRGVLIALNIDPEIIERLQKSASLATVTKATLYNDSKPLLGATKRIAIAVSNVCDEITVLSSRLSTDPGEMMPNA